MAKKIIQIRGLKNDCRSHFPNSKAMSPYDQQIENIYIKLNEINIPKPTIFSQSHLDIELLTKLTTKCQ